MPGERAGLYIGIMSGTSMDAVDAVLLQAKPSGRVHVLDGVSVAIPDTLRTELLALNSPGQDELARGALASIELARLYADAVTQVLQASATPHTHISAIGAHGQTVRHRPDLGYTVQLNAPALLAELTGIDVIADFRSRDIAAGGQGAPLVPAFHAAQFAAAQTRVVLNLGGIANITILAPDSPLRGFDTGPANMLMDAWAQRHLGKPYDANGAWATTGQPPALLLKNMLADPWFELPPPKSTGRDDFNPAWLHRKLQQTFGEDENTWPAAADIQAGLLQLTAQSVAGAIREHAPLAADVLVCGGGSGNGALMTALQAALPCPLARTDDYGLPAQWVEAAAFAWLAWCHDTNRPAGLPGVTGARKPSILGCRHLA